MTPQSLSPQQRLAAAAIGLVLVAGAAGYGIAQLGRPGAPAPAGAANREVLYWYDPMVPGQRFDKPGKSPFMDMQLVPKYADEAQGAGVRIDAGRVQNLGARIATAQRGTIASGGRASGVIAFNERDIAIVQARAGGFVQRAYRRAPGDVVGAGAPIVDLLIPEWGGAQAEFLAVRRTGDAALIGAARQRLTLLGMPASLVALVERSGQPRTTVTITTPSGGVIQTLSVRPGMTVTAGQTLAEINGLGTVWLNAAVPEAMAGQLRPGLPVTATLAAFPSERFGGTIAAILPQAEAASRTLTVRVELANRGGRLRPGMFAEVELFNAARPALLVPSEAVIRTGARTLVMLALDGGRFQPAEVQVGQESGGRTEILAGLSEGEKVVASGQFLIDSEASLTGVRARPAGEPGVRAAPALHQSSGRIEQLSATAVTLSHEPVPALGWPAMTMQFKLADPQIASGLKVGERVAFAFDQPAAGPTVRRMSRLGAAR